MKFSELQSKEKNELREILEETRLKLGKLRFELANKSLKDVSQIGKIKKDIARVLTALKISAEGGSASGGKNNNAEFKNVQKF